jgi:hypothetical protein
MVNTNVIAEINCRASFMCFFVIPIPLGVDKTDIFETINNGLRASWVDDVGWAMDVKRTTVHHLQTRTRLLQQYRDMQDVDYALVCNDAFVSGVWFSDIHLTSGEYVGDLKPNADAKRTILSYILNGDSDKIMVFEKIGVLLETTGRHWFSDIEQLKAT